MRKRCYLLLGILLISSLVVGFPGCAQSPATQEPIKIGLELDMTGAWADQGPPVKEGIELRLEEAKYQVAGRPIKLFMEDGATDTSIGFEKVKKLVTVDKIDLMIGPFSSGVSMTAAPYFKENKIPAIALNSKPHALSDTGYAIVPDGSLYQEGIAGGWYAYEKLGFRTVSTVGMDATAGREGMAGFVDAFSEKGGKVIQQQWTPPPTMDFAPFITALQKADAVVIWFAAGQSMQFAKQYKEFGQKTPLYLVMAGLVRDSQLKGMGNAILGVQGGSSYTWHINTPVSKKFAEAYRTKYGKNSDMTAQNGYNGVSIALAALEATKGDTSYEKLVPALRAVKLEAPSGNISFDSASGLAIKTYHIVEARMAGDEYFWEPVTSYDKIPARAPKK